MLFKSAYKNIFAACFTGCVFLCACSNSDKEIRDLNSKSLAREEVKNVDINYTLGGKAKAKLLAPLMYRVQDTMPYVEFPKKIHVDFYNDTSGVDSRMDALYGKYFETQSKVFLRDSVRIINVKGDTLYCKEMWWDRQRKGSEFYTDKPVRIRTRTQIIDGVGMESSQDFKDWVITGSQGFIIVPRNEYPGQ
jgi:hypothetical protein